jgi:bis(5'-adenosyl)-triphosphatase
MENSPLPDISCPFCSIKLKESVFLESGDFIAIYNIAPILEGHSLVIPRRHIESIYELHQAEMEEFFKFAAQATKILMKTFNGEGFDWSFQQGEVAGQTVAHVHLHIVIRKPGDLPGSGEWYEEVRKNESILLESKSRQRLSPDEMRTIVKKIRDIADIDFVK